MGGADTLGWAGLGWEKLWRFKTRLFFSLLFCFLVAAALGEYLSHTQRKREAERGGWVFMRKERKGGKDDATTLTWSVVPEQCTGTVMYILL